MASNVTKNRGIGKGFVAVAKSLAKRANLFYIVAVANNLTLHAHL